MRRRSGAEFSFPKASQIAVLYKQTAVLYQQDAVFLKGYIFIIIPSMEKVKKNGKKAKSLNAAPAQKSRFQAFYARNLRNFGGKAAKNCGPSPQSKNDEGESWMHFCT